MNNSVSVVQGLLSGVQEFVLLLYILIVVCFFGVILEKVTEGYVCIYLELPKGVNITVFDM